MKIPFLKGILALLLLCTTFTAPAQEFPEPCPTIGGAMGRGAKGQGQRHTDCPEAQNPAGSRTNCHHGRLRLRRRSPGRYRITHHPERNHPGFPAGSLLYRHRPRHGHPDETHQRGVHCRTICQTRRQGHRMVLRAFHPDYFPCPPVQKASQHLYGR